MKMYEILNEEQALLQEIEKGGGEISEEEEKHLSVVYEKLSNKLDKSKLAFVMMKKKAEGLRDMANFYLECAQAIDRAYDRFEAYIINQMLIHQKTQISGENITVKLVRNRPCVIHPNPMILPEEFARYTKPKREADKEKIRKEIEAGRAPEGCSLQESYRLKWGEK